MKTNAEILEDIIKSRRSIFPKDYTAEAIPQDVLDKILNPLIMHRVIKRPIHGDSEFFRGLEKTELGRLWQSYTKQLHLRKHF
jgi:hypothetical protein